MSEKFVFGSNLAGRHGKGSALEAVKRHGAVYGQGEGPQGNSYAIPTKDQWLKRMSLASIQPYVEEFLSYARSNPETKFNVVAIGCGLAGYEPCDIAPMFANSPPNVSFVGNWNE